MRCESALWSIILKAIHCRILLDEKEQIIDGEEYMQTNGYILVNAWEIRYSLLEYGLYEGEVKE